MTSRRSESASSRQQEGAGTESRAYGATFDWESIHPSTAVPEAVARAKGMDPTDLEPLYKYVETDALDALFGGRGGTGIQRVTFEFAEDRITVHKDGRVEIDLGTD